MAFSRLIYRGFAKLMKRQRELETLSAKSQFGNCGRHSIPGMAGTSQFVGIEKEHVLHGIAEGAHSRGFQGEDKAPGEVRGTPP